MAKKKQVIPKSTVTSIEAHTVFHCLADDGDFKKADLMFYTGKSTTKFGEVHYQIVFDDGSTDWLTLEELNIDPTSIRQHNPDSDPDFYFYLG